MRAYFGTIRLDDVVVFALVTVLSVSGWFEFVVAAEGDVAGGPVAAAAAAGLGAFVIFSVRYVQRLRRPADPFARELHVPLIFLPAVSGPLLFLVITPPGAPADGFLPGVGIYGVIALTVLLTVAGVLSGLLVFGLLVWPTLLLVDAVRPPAGSAGGLSLLSRSLSRGGLVGSGVTILAAVGWGSALAAAYPQAQGDSRQRRFETIVAWVTLRAEPVPSIVALVFFSAAVFAVWLTVRSEHPRSQPVHTELGDH